MKEKVTAEMLNHTDLNGPPVGPRGQRPDRVDLGHCGAKQGLVVFPPSNSSCQVHFGRPGAPLECAHSTPPPPRKAALSLKGSGLGSPGSATWPLPSLRFSNSQMFKVSFRTSDPSQTKRRGSGCLRGRRK